MGATIILALIIWFFEFLSDYFWMIIICVVIIFVFAIIIAVGSSIACEICGVEFSERAKRHDYIDGDIRHVICSKCKRRLDEKASAEGVKEFLSKRSGQ